MLGRKSNPSRCFGCAYEFRAFLGLLQSCTKRAASFASNPALSCQVQIDDRHSDIAAVGSHRGSFGGFTDLFGLFLASNLPGRTLVPTGSLGALNLAVFPGSLRVRLWQPRDPSKHADKPNRVSQALGLIDGWPVWNGRVRICFADLPTRRVFDVTERL